MTNLERQSTTSIPNKDTQHLFSDISVELQSALDGVQALPATFGQWEATFSLTPPEPNLFDSFEPPNETSVQSEKLPQDKSSGCFNLESMLSHLSGTLRPRTSVSAMGFDEILQTIETSLDVARNFVRCETCFKSSMELVSVALLLQRIASLFDFVAHGTVKKQAPNLGMGVYKLSAEDEIDFKRMVVSKLAKKAEQLLELLVGLAQELFGLGDHNSTWQDVTVPGLHLRNLSYVRDTSRDIKSCIQNAMGVVQARDWGLRQLVVD
ncbi:MAG: hypothetical protein LQ342_006578 [Letrouitia transgressa]|nr:MAG: hypothetical protein LQ342_006578 [Letrouitia transgressa]